MIKLIKKEEAIPRKVANTYTVFQMLTKDISSKLGMVISKAETHKEVALNTVSDRIYYILKGSGKFKVEDKEITANTGDLVFISANTKYFFEGTFEAVQVMSPPFDPNNEPLDTEGNKK